MSNIFDQLTSNKDVEKINNNSDEDNCIASEERTITSNISKRVTQELLRSGLIESLKKPDLYKHLLTQKLELRDILEPLDLAISIDELRGIAYLSVIKNEDDDVWNHSLVRKKPLTLEQSFLVAILRQHYINYESEYGLGSQNITISTEDILVQINTYFGESGSEIHDKKKLSNLIDKLNIYGVISGSIKDDDVKINPIIVHIANHENLSLLLTALKSKIDNSAVKTTGNQELEAEEIE